MTTLVCGAVVFGAIWMAIRALKNDPHEVEIKVSPVRLFTHRK